VHCEIVRAAGAESVHARIFPDIGPVAAVLTELEGIDMSGLAVFEDKAELVF
jgi:hypothetical protein